MKKISLFSALLLIGLVGSQFLPIIGETLYYPLVFILKILTMIFLSFIMIQVGLEFTINKNRWRQYGFDYIIAATAAAFPWLFCAIYFVYFLPNNGPIISQGDLWKEALLAARFAAPTSAGVLFSMLVAAGLGASWVFRKARILAIFDDLDTILLMIPLKMAMVGLKWELGIIVVAVFGLLWIAWKKLHSVSIPYTWDWVLKYSILITLFSESVYILSTMGKGITPIHFEILLPAFVMGCIIERPKDPDTGIDLMHIELSSPEEKKVATIISACFMMLVGLSMPPFLGISLGSASNGSPLPTLSKIMEALSGNHPPIPGMEWKSIFFHVIIITILSNLGKMAPAFCYKKEATLQERIALSIGMCPRGEVGAGVLMVALSLGIEGPMVLVALLSLALNLCLTGFFISIIKILLKTKSHKWET